MVAERYHMITANSLLNPDAQAIFPDWFGIITTIADSSAIELLCLKAGGNM
jgi:hypothetical protein